ncbi:AraC family transcriptional regulator [Burkholderia pseudomallei]|nr:AraC family transcriptional regulator [Burkholderia pseudomallei]ARL65669.1 AraC family transcriptional regulator [Burkholderia pseudomallei]ARL74173.1 AraC family transcriptional regulator [Burkholderia pseudomallei]
MRRRRRQRRQAASGKRQAASGKRQAASGKRQAASGKRQAATMLIDRSRSKPSANRGRGRAILGAAARCDGNGGQTRIGAPAARRRASLPRTRSADRLALSSARRRRRKQAHAPTPRKEGGRPTEPVVKLMPVAEIRFGRAAAFPFVWLPRDARPNGARRAASGRYFT